MATGLLSTIPTTFPTMTKPYSGPAISVSPITTTSNTSGLIASGSGAANNAANANLTTTKPLIPSMGVKAKAPATTTPTTTLPANQVNNTPKPTVQATTDGGTSSTGTAGTTQPIPAYGSNVYSSQTGALQGTAQFNPNTGAPLANPNVTNVTGQPAPQNLGLYGQLINQASQSVGGNAAITQNTQNEVNQTAQQIAQLQQGANTQEQAYQTGMIAPRAQGLAQNVASTEANQQTALQGQLSNELTAGGQALTGQQQTQSGLLSAAGLAAPTGNIINVDPTTGLPVAGGSLGNLANVAGTVAGIQSGAAAAAAAGGQTQAQNTIASGTAPTTAAAQNTIAAGTTPTTTAAQGYTQSTQQYQAGTTAFSTANQQANNLLSLMNNNGINSSNSQDYNTTVDQLASKLGSTQMSAFTASLAEAQQGYTSLLASVGAATPTVNGQQATAVLSPSSTPAQIQAAVSALNYAAYAKLAPQYQQALNYYNNLTGQNASAIPGYAAPTPPAGYTTALQGADTSAGNLGQEGAGAAVQGLDAIVGGVGAAVKWITSL